MNQAGLPPVVLDPNILSKRVETSPTTTQFGLACAQIMPRLPRAHLQQAELFQMSCGKCRRGSSLDGFLRDISDVEL